MIVSAGPGGGANSHGIPYTNNGVTSTNLSQAVVFQSDYLADGPFYMDVWASADIVPVSGTATLQLYLLDGDTNIWHRATTKQVGAQKWYVFQILPGTTTYTVPSGNVAAIALTANRSDNPAGGWLKVDNWYVYNSARYKPTCDGNYPDEVQHDSNVGILWPKDKPCPDGRLFQSNNFWGPLITYFTLLMYQIFRDAQYHLPGIWVAWGKTTVIEPVLSLWLYMGVLFDWTWPITFASLAIVVWAFSLVTMVWKSAKRIVNPLN
jgi:hypothetical protein